LDLPANINELTIIAVDCLYFGNRQTASRPS